MMSKYYRKSYQVTNMYHSVKNWLFWLNWNGMFIPQMLSSVDIN